MILKALTVGQFEVNCYILGCPDTAEAIIIDPGADYPRINARLTELGLSAKLIVNTHGHADHISANFEFNLPVWIHAKDAAFLTDAQKNLSAFFGFAVKSPPPAHLLKECEMITLGSIALKVMHTPGHTPGSICLFADGVLFSGDTLFKAGVGRTDFALSSEDQLLKSIKNKLFKLPDDTRVYPGHGPSTTIGEEKRHNPFVCDSMTY